jgi:hypothetical protein
VVYKYDIAELPLKIPGDRGAGRSMTGSLPARCPQLRIVPVNMTTWAVMDVKVAVQCDRV